MLEATSLAYADVFFLLVQVVVVLCIEAPESGQCWTAEQNAVQAVPVERGIDAEVVRRTGNSSFWRPPASKFIEVIRHLRITAGQSDAKDLGEERAVCWQTCRDNDNGGVNRKPDNPRSLITCRKLAR